MAVPFGFCHNFSKMLVAIQIWVHCHKKTMRFVAIKAGAPGLKSRPLQGGSLSRKRPHITANREIRSPRPGPGRCARRPGPPPRGCPGPPPATPVAPFGPQVDDPVRLGDQVQVVLHRHHQVPGRGQAAQGGQQPVHVGRRPGPGRARPGALRPGPAPAPGGPAGPARRRRCRSPADRAGPLLAQAQVAQAQVRQGLAGAGRGPGCAGTARPGPPPWPPARRRWSGPSTRHSSTSGRKPRPVAVLAAHGHVRAAGPWPR